MQKLNHCPQGPQTPQEAAQQEEHRKDCFCRQLLNTKTRSEIRDWIAKQVNSDEWRTRFNRVDREMRMIVLHKDQGIVARAIYNGEQA